MKHFPTLLVLLGLVRSVNGRLNTNRQEQEEEFHVIIGMKDEYGLGIVSRLSQLMRTRFKRVNAVSAIVTQSQMDALMSDPGILYVEEDGVVYPDGEAVLYGLQMVQAYSSVVPTKNVTSTAACNDPASFKIAVSTAGQSIMGS
jgi:hypothetical protein